MKKFALVKVFEIKSQYEFVDEVNSFDEVPYGALKNIGNSGVEVAANDTRYIVEVYEMGEDSASIFYLNGELKETMQRGEE